MGCLIFCCVVLLITAAWAQNTHCYDALDCVTEEILQAAFTRDQVLLCKLAPDVVKCAELENKQCDNDNMANVNKESIDRFKDTLQECSQNNSDSINKMALCTMHFKKCFTNDLKHAAKNKNDTRLCELYSPVIDCMESALKTYCMHIKNVSQTQLLYVEVDKLEKQFPTSPCMISKSMFHLFVPFQIPLWT